MHTGDAAIALTKRVLYNEIDLYVVDIKAYKILNVKSQFEFVTASMLHS